MNERNLNEGQWEDRKQWSLGVGQRRKTFWNRYIHTYIHVQSYLFQSESPQLWLLYWPFTAPGSVFINYGALC
jgi:hypothetical protein